MQQLKPFLFFIFLLSLAGCSEVDKNDDPGAWFGGEIINPYTDYVILTRNNIVLDSIYLNEKNRFLYRIDSVRTGIYNFIHNEYQMMYLEPGDSVLIRLNTADFDESLTYTGRGAKRNNFLINLFLDIERENLQMPLYYQLEPVAFLKKVDSMQEQRQKNLDRFIKKNKPGKSFEEVLQASALYDYYLKKEIYPYAHYGSNNADIKLLPAGYYDFRKKIDYNNTKLQSYYPYYRFLNRHFDHLAFESYKDDSPYDRTSFKHVNKKLNLISNNVSSSPLKNNLLRTAARNFILNSRSYEDQSRLLENFARLNSDTTFTSELNQLAAATSSLLPGNYLPNLILLTTDNQPVYLNSIIKNPTVIYFWSLNSVNHYKDAHAKALELRHKYPEFDFIAINTDKRFEEWLKVINRNNYPKAYQYQFTDPTESIEGLVLNTINKAMITNKEGNIINHNTSLFNPTLEEELLGILNK